MCRGCTSHLKLVKRELRTMRPNTTDQETHKQTNKKHKPTNQNPKTKARFRNSSRLCQPIEKGETWGYEFSLCTQYVTITSFSHFPMRRQHQHSCSSQSSLSPSREDLCQQWAMLQMGYSGSSTVVCRVARAAVARVFERCLSGRSYMGK